MPKGIEQSVVKYYFELAVNGHFSSRLNAFEFSPKIVSRLCQRQQLTLQACVNIFGPNDHHHCTLYEISRPSEKSAIERQNGLSPPLFQTTKKKCSDISFKTLDIFPTIFNGKHSENHTKWTKKKKYFHLNRH